jgi:hypothetical protein
MRYTPGFWDSFTLSLCVQRAGNNLFSLEWYTFIPASFLKILSILCEAGQMYSRQTDDWYSIFCCILCGVFIAIDRLRKDDATSKTTWMSSFGANYRQLLVCHVVLDDFTTRKCNFHVLSRTSKIFCFFWKKYESMHDKNHPILFPMYWLMILVKGFSLTRLFFLSISLNFEHVNFWQILSVTITNQQNCKHC